MTNRIYKTISIFLLFISLGIWMSINIHAVSAISPDQLNIITKTPLATQTPVPISTLSVTSSPIPSLTADEAISVYSIVATTVMENADRVLNFTFIMLSIVVTIAIGAGGVIAYIVRVTGQAKASAERSAEAAATSQKSIQEPEQQVKKALSDLAKLEGQVQNAFLNLTKLEDNVTATNKEIRYAQRELQETSHILLIFSIMYEIEKSAAEIASDDEQIRQITLQKLVEFSRDVDPVIRRWCIRVWDNLLSYPDLNSRMKNMLVSRLQEMQEYDGNTSVRLEAKRVLNKSEMIPNS